MLESVDSISGIWGTCDEKL